MRLTDGVAAGKSVAIAAGSDSKNSVYRECDAQVIMAMVPGAIGDGYDCDSGHGHEDVAMPPGPLHVPRRAFTPPR